jgi:hypothetical protein
VRYQDISKSIKLDELMDSSTPYQVTKKTDSFFSTEATVRGRLIKFSADRQLDLNGKSVWEVLFGELKAGETRSTFELTGSGGEFEVLSAVTASMKEFVSTYDPGIIRFASNGDPGDSRAGVYERMVQRFFPANQYDLKKSATYSATYFWIEKK